MHRLAVHRKAPDAFFHMRRIRHMDMIGDAAEEACNIEITEIRRYTGIY